MLTLLLAASVATATPACTPATAQRTTVAAIGDNLERYLGRCVRVGGPFTSISLHGSVDDLYLTRRYMADGNQDQAALRRGRIGLYGRDNALRTFKPRTDGIPHLDIVGTVDSCSAIYARAEEAMRAKGDLPIVMLGGYCHYYGGAVLRAVDYTAHPTRRYDRLLGEANRERVGNLVAMPSDWPHAEALEKALLDFRTMLRTGDRAALGAAHDFLASEDNPHDREVLDMLLARPDSPWAPARAATVLPARVFVGRHNVERRDAGRADADISGGVLCICRTGDCVGKWPIASADADNGPRRPYACTFVNWHGGREGKGNRRLFTTPLGRDGWLGEPPAANNGR